MKLLQVKLYGEIFKEINQLSNYQLYISKVSKFALPSTYRTFITPCNYTCALEVFNATSRITHKIRTVQRIHANFLQLKPIKLLKFKQKYYITHSPQNHENFSTLYKLTSEFHSEFDNLPLTLVLVTTTMLAQERLFEVFSLSVHKNVFNILNAKGLRTRTIATRNRQW